MEERDSPDASGSRQVDEAMLPMSAFFAEMTDVDGYLVDDEMGTAAQLQKVEMSFPMELDIQVSEDGSLLLGGSPPLYYTETTFVPVFHQLKIEITVEMKTDEDAGSSQ